jgi:ABC-type multidrug transport system fused ATPase/permease subunit
VVIATGLLIYVLGPSSLVGFGIMILYIPFQHWLTSMLTKFRRSSNEVSDKRVKIINEAIAGIRIIKIYAWEQSFEKIISELRQKELVYILKYLLVRSLVSSITQVVPTFAMIASFICYSMLGNTLNPPLVFASLGLFYALRVPLLIMPMALSLVYCY